MYWRRSWGCMSAVVPENRYSFDPVAVFSRIFASCTCQPSMHSNCIRSSHIASWVKFCMCTSRNTFSRSWAESNAVGERGK